MTTAAAAATAAATTTSLKPPLIILSPPTAYLHHHQQFTSHFTILNFSDSDLSLPAFLATASAAGAAAMLTSNSCPPIDEDTVFRHIPTLRCIVISAAGVDRVDVGECRRRGIVVANAADVYSDDCADVAVALLFDVLRKVSYGDRFVRSGAWVDDGAFCLGNRLSGKRVGIVGLGSIGSKVATRLEAFGCHISYTSRASNPTIPYPFYSNVCDLASNNDVLVLCCALTHQTRHIINKKVLLSLGKAGVVINIARGGVIDEQELVKCLVEGKIAGAGLDVFENEPLVPKELLGLDNVVVSPHIAYLTSESMRDMCEHLIANLKAFFDGKPLLSPV